MKSKATSPVIVELIVRHFAPMEDPRISRTRHHPLINVLVMALCGCVGGADGWDGLEAFAEARLDWFSTFLDMPHGAPSADTFRRVFCALNPVAFEACMRSWVRAFTTKLVGEVLAIDGKALRGAVEWATSKTPLHLVHVWATEQRLLLAQVAVDGAPGEVQAIPGLLAMLDIAGATITTDANGCTSATTQAARAGDANYVLALKGNRAQLHAHVLAAFAQMPESKYVGAAIYRSEDTGHGRTEIREARVLELKDWPTSAKSNWADLRTAMQIDRIRIVKEEITGERHYYISDLPPDAERIAEAARSHWGVENQLHWSLDVGFGEDRRVIRNQNGAQNFASMTRLALMLLRAEKSGKYGLPTRRKQAAWNNDYLVKVIASEIGAK